MKQIILTQGKVALVDDSDYEYLSQFKWYAAKHRNIYWYAQRRSTEGSRKMILMHRQILGLTDTEIFADHEDHNTLNNQRYNLRIATPAENSANKSSHRNSSSKYLGVCWDKKRLKWRVRIMANGVNKNIGWFSSDVEAALAYNNAAINLHGNFANINNVAA